MIETTLQGVLVIGTTTIYMCPVGKNAKLNIRFTDIAAYNLKVARYTVLSGVTVDLYNIALAAGDTVVDSSLYPLTPGDYIAVTTSSATTNYSAYILEMP